MSNSFLLNETRIYRRCRRMNWQHQVTSLKVITHFLLEWQTRKYSKCMISCSSSVPPMHAQFLSPNTKPTDRWGPKIHHQLGRRHKAACKKYSRDAELCCTQLSTHIYHTQGPGFRLVILSCRGFGEKPSHQVRQVSPPLYPPFPPSISLSY